MHSRVVATALFAALLTGCAHDGDAADGDMVVGGSPLEILHDPETCRSCHPKHVREWSASMHAYAAEDPVFAAMNRRGQEETGGELGDFCISCHAPMAVALGLTQDGLNLDEVPPKYEGVTCYFCHNVESVATEHDNPLKVPANNPLRLAHDKTMRGGVTDARRPGAHAVAYSPMHDGDLPASAQLCGPCHDIVTAAGVHLERTFQEWKDSVFSRTDGGSFNSCVGCHMPSRDDLIAETHEVAVTARRRGFHGHLMPGVDAALTPFPDHEAHLSAIECELAEAVQVTQMTVRPNGQVTLEIETSRTGHGWPSGSAQDRRAWVEVRAYDAAGRLRVSIGAIDNDKPLPRSDPQLFVMRDFIYGADGEEVHMFWDASPSAAYPAGYRSTTLPITLPSAQRGDVPPPHHVEAQFMTFMDPARVEVAIKIRPIGFDLVDDLIASGHLPQDTDLKSRIQTHTLNLTKMVWDRTTDSSRTVEVPAAEPLDCPNRWLCQLYPGRPGCGG